MSRFIVAWYGWLSGLTQGLVLGLQDLAEGIALPAAAAVILGLIGATSPCQLTTNLGALAYAAGRPGRGSAIGLALAYVAGKVTVYTLVGAAVALTGLQPMAIPGAVVARRALGPLMVVVGLVLLGVWRPRFSLGHRLAARLRRKVEGTGATGAYVLGLLFSLAFCPTLFWLFFGLTIPLALKSAGGWAFAGLFAVGSSLPLLAVAALVTTGTGAVEVLAGSLRRLERPVRVIAAAVLMIAGLHDTLVYWTL